MEVTLEKMLLARERRAARQRELIKQGGTLITVLVNMPGGEKLNDASRAVFYAGLNALVRELKREEIQLTHEERQELETGCEAYLLTDCAARRVKLLACGLEDGLGYGRLLDIDVSTQSGKLTRADVGLEPRGCMVCGRAGADCFSRRLHPMDEVMARVRELAALAEAENG